MTSDKLAREVWRCVSANTNVGGCSHGVAPPTYGSHVTGESVKKPGRFSRTFGEQRKSVSYIRSAEIVWIHTIRGNRGNSRTSPRIAGESAPALGEYGPRLCSPVLTIPLVFSGESREFPQQRSYAVFVMRLRTVCFSACCFLRRVCFPARSVQVSAQ
jgi:hypothetical protein